MLTVRRLRAPLLASALLACSPAPPAPDSPATPPTASAAAAPTASAAAAPSPHDGAIAGLTRLHAAMPGEGAVVYLLAHFNGLAGRRDEAIRWLDELARGPWDLGLAAADFPSLADDPRYRDLARRLDARAPAVPAGAVAFRLPERDLIPEGIAYDPKRKDVLVGSMVKRKIIRVRPDGKISDLVPPAAGGIGSVIGIRVDPARDALWAAANPKKYTLPPSLDAKHALHQFSLESGAPIASYPLPDDGAPHLLNDIAVGGDGTVYVTDSEGGSVFRLKPGAARLEPIVPAGSFEYANGVTLGPDGRALLVADALGIWRIDPESGERARLAAPPGVSLGGIDGLYLDGGALVAMQNGFGVPRLVRFELDAAGARVTGAKVLCSLHPELEIPTTAALAGGDAYVIANSQLRSRDAEGLFLPAERLQETRILKVPAR